MLTFAHSQVSMALASLAELFVRPSPHVVISYAANFERLWNFESLGLEGNERIILVWDGTRDGLALGAIDLSEFLSPLTWALSALDRWPKLQISIFDAIARPHLRDRIYRFYSALLPELRPFQLLSFHTLLSNIWDEIGLSPMRQEGFDHLIRYLRHILTEHSPESNRHAISNIIAPLLLMGCRLPVVSNIYSKPLLALFFSIGLIADDQDSDKTQIATWTIKNRIPSFPIRVLLIDDQAKQGWTDWVKSRLSRLGGGITVYFHETADQLVDILVRYADGPSPRRLLGSPFADTILLLDLRLFSRKHESVEAEWIRKRLVPLLDREVFSPFFEAEERAKIISWCNNPSRNTDAYHLVLSILPRLVSYMDYSVPIVIFSNTSQKSIVEALVGRANILIGFSKPRFDGTSGQQLKAETESKFDETIEKSLKWLTAGRFLRRLLIFPETHVAGDHRQTAAPFNHFELFLDESDVCEYGRYFNVGGCFALFQSTESMKHAKEKAERFNSLLVSKGLIYYDDRIRGNLLFLKKREKDWIPILEVGMADKNLRPARLGLVRLKEDRRDAPQCVSVAFEGDFADNRYHSMLERLIEAFLSISVPAILRGMPDYGCSSISVFPATRIVNVDDEAVYKFGFQELRHARRPMYYSFSRSDLFPIVRRVLEKYNIEIEIERLVAQTLVYEIPAYSESPVLKPEYYYCAECRRPFHILRREDVSFSCQCADGGDYQADLRALHYIADEVLSCFPNDSRPDYCGQVFLGDLTGEFDELLNSRYEAVLKSRERLSQNNLPAALCELHVAFPWILGESELQARGGRLNKAFHWYLPQLKDRIVGMNEDEYSILAKLLDDTVTNDGSAGE